MFCSHGVYFGFTLSHTEVAGGRASRFRNHSVSSSSGFDISRGRSQTAPLFLASGAPEVAPPSPPVTAGLWHLAQVRALAETQVLSKALALVLVRSLLRAPSPAAAAPELQHYPEQRRERPQQAQDSQTERSGAATPLPPPPRPPGTLADPPVGTFI